MITVIYITNNILDETIDGVCKKNILEATEGLRLISVSQKPIDFGENICVGELPTSSLSINMQMMEGLKRVKTDYIAIAEHDCLYNKEHFNFIPPKKDVFYYNENCWVLQYYSGYRPEYNGMFSTFPKRKANSQLICSTDIMIKATQDRIDMMSDPVWLNRYPLGRIGEAGLMTEKQVNRLAIGSKVAHIKKQLLEYIDKYKAENFKTIIPNLDIRHQSNLTKNRRGFNRTFDLPYWGTIDNIFEKYGFKYNNPSQK